MKGCERLSMEEKMQLFLRFRVILTSLLVGASASSVAWAQGAGSGPSVWEQLMPFVFILIIFYFLLIRPQQRRAKNHQIFLEGLRRGDSVLTSGGILGTIEGLTDQYVTLEIAKDVRIRILKTQIASPANSGEDKK